MESFLVDYFTDWSYLESLAIFENKSLFLKSKSVYYLGLGVNLAEDPNFLGEIDPFY